MTKPTLRIDFPYWATQPDWTAEETVALSLNRPPEYITLQVLRKQHGYEESDFYQEYKKRLDWIIKAQERGHLLLRIPPMQAIAWLDKNEIYYPPILKEAVYEK